MTYLPPSTLTKLDTPHHIYYSVPRLLFSSLLMLGGGLGFLIGGTSMVLKAKVGQQLDPVLWLFFAVGMLLVIVFTLKCLPTWFALGKPAATLSKAGLQFRGKPLISWPEIETNDWNSVYSGGVRAAASIAIKVGCQKFKVNSSHFKCHGEEYLHCCELYAAAAAQS